MVESVRTGRGSRQRVVAYLGELKRSERSGWAQLGRTLSGKEKPRRSLFDPPHYDEPSEDEPVLVRLRSVRLERLRDCGDVWMALGLWRLLGLDTLLEKVAPAGREEVPWPVVAAILCIARFCRPQSGLHIESTWYRGAALEDLLGVPVEKVHTDRLYGGLDWLLPHKPTIEKHLKDRLGTLFDLEYDLLLYDITSTYFEGQCAANPLAKRGYSRDGRPDCLQVCIGLVVTSDGIPLGYEVFAGNRNDATTVEEIVEAMLRKFEEHLTEKDWREVQEGVEVKLVPGPEGDETFILARSADRREKEKAMHERFVERLEDALQKMQSAAESGRLKDEAVANRRLGRLLGQYWRAAGAFEVKIQRLSPPEGKQRLRVTWRRNRRWSEWAALSEGCYLLRANLNETDPAVLWKRYIQLTEAEWAFRITKDELEIRPIWHQKEDRVLAHILVCFLAYVLWKTLAQWMRRSGLGDAPRTVLEELAKIKSGDVVLPTQNKRGHDTGSVRLRCVTAPDEAQKVLLNRLGITLPRRLRRIDEVVQM
ncbi:MAG: IS1634 family transposase [Planctomycetota bacterium]